MSEHDLLDTDLEVDLRSTLRDLLADHRDVAAMTALYDEDRTLVDSLWRTLAADLGLAGLLVPETRGGAGASAREAAVVLEELGRAVAPVPFLTSAVVATTALLDSEQPTCWPSSRSGTAYGRTRRTAVDRSRRRPSFGARIRRSADRTVTSVAGALDADVLLVPAATSRGMGLFAVAVGDATLGPVVSLDMTRQLADLSLDGAAGTLVLADAEAAVPTRARWPVPPC